MEHNPFDILEIEIKALSAYPIEPNIIKSMLETLERAKAYQWVAFDFYKLETRPPVPEKYLICRKDGKIHWETWNGSGWAYNHNEIRYWAKIINPILK